MTTQCRWAQLGLLALAGLAFAGCAVPVRVESYVERGADLSLYRTYDVAPAAAESTGDPRLDSNPFFNERVRAAVERELGVRGYERTTAGAPGFRVHFHASVAQGIDVNTTLVIDVVDVGTNKLAWRGWARTSMREVVDNQAWMEERIDTVVAKIMANMPRSS